MLLQLILEKLKILRIQPKLKKLLLNLKLNTAYSQLRENLSGNKENLTVYVGRTQIENDIPDASYDQSNALTFVIFNQLNLDLNNEQRTTLANIGR